MPRASRREPSRRRASSFVNPLTAWAWWRRCAAKATPGLVHTAAASNLGRMLKPPLPRRRGAAGQHRAQTQQAEILRDRGRQVRGDSTAPDVQADLTEALGGHVGHAGVRRHRRGKVAGQTEGAWKWPPTSTAAEYSRYGSTTYKQVYIYGGLDRGPTEFNRNFGMAWGMGGWLLTPFLQKIGAEAMRRLQQRVVAGLTTTFASMYTKEVSSPRRSDGSRVRDARQSTARGT